jgi:hypothetical protein
MKKPRLGEHTAVGVVSAHAGLLLVVKVAGAALALAVAVHVLLGPFTVVARVAQPAAHQAAALGPITYQKGVERK